MPNGSLYVLGTLVNNGKYAHTIESNDPDKGLFTYHKGIQSTWKDDVTQQNIMYGGIYVNLTKQFVKDNAIWQPQPDAKGLIENNGDIVLCPGELINFGTVKNLAGSHIYSCAADEAIVPIEPDTNNPTVTTKKVTFDTPKGSYIENFGTIENAGQIRPAYVKVEEKTRALGAIEVDTVAEKFKDCFIFLTYAGTYSGDGFLYKHDLARAKIDLMFGPLVVDSAPYDGLSWDPDIRAKTATGIMEYYAPDDFSVTYKDPDGRPITNEGMIDAGTYKLELSEGPMLTGNVTKTFTIEPAVLSAVELNADSFVYDGKMHAPTPKSVTAKSGDREFSVPANGYTVNYSPTNPISAGTYTVTVTGKGNYSGSIAKTFTISEPAPAPTPTPTPTPVVLPEITSATLDAFSYTYDGNVHKPAVTSVKAGDVDVPATGYTVSYSTENPKEPGVYIVTITGKGSYTGTITKEFVIEKKDVSPVTRPKITDVELSADTFTYDGAVHKPEPASVKSGSTEIISSFYSLEYSSENPTDAGEYTLTIKGEGSYAGSSVVKTFKIVPANLSDATLSANTFAYDGKAHKPTIASVKAGSLSVPATGYSLSYSNANPKAVGTYTATVTGKGNFTGTVKKTFDINKANNTLVLKGKTVSLKKAAIAKKSKAYKRAKLMGVSRAQGTVTYKLASVNKAKFKKYFKVAKTTGNVTVKKGLKKGNYKVRVNVTAAGNSGYKPVTKAVTFTVKVVA